MRLSKTSCERVAHYFSSAKGVFPDASRVLSYAGGPTGGKARWRPCGTVRKAFRGSERTMTHPAQGRQAPPTRMTDTRPMPIHIPRAQLPR